MSAAGVRIGYTLYKQGDSSGKPPGAGIEGKTHPSHIHHEAPLLAGLHGWFTVALSARCRVPKNRKLMGNAMIMKSYRWKQDNVKNDKMVPVLDSDETRL